MRSHVLLLLLLLLAGRPSAAGAAGGDERLCAEAIRLVERRAGTPRGLLQAVAMSESGHRASGTGTAAPWPWTVNNAGDGRFFPTKAEARAWVERLRADGRRNIDVGCIQVNLMHHPDAFATLDEALDPVANVAYGARFLASLRDETASWDKAVARYHSATPGLGEAYRDKVYARWDDATPEPPPAAAKVTPVTTVMAGRPTSAGKPVFWPSSGLSRPVRAMPGPMPSARSLRFFALQSPGAEPQVVAMREPSAPAAGVPAAAEAPPTLASPRFIPLRSFGGSAAASAAAAAPLPLKPLPARAVWTTVAHVEAGRGRGASPATEQARQGTAGSRIGVLGGPSLFASAR